MEKRKTVKDHNRKSGNNRMEMEYEEECEAIAARDDSIEPEVVRGVGYIRRKVENSTATTTSTSNATAILNTPVIPSNVRWAKKKTSTQVMRETMLEIEARREARSAAIEERREQRHQKKIAL